MASARARMISCTRSMLARFRPPYRRASCSASASIQNARCSTPSTMRAATRLGFDDCSGQAVRGETRCDVLPDREVVAGQVGAGEWRHDDPDVEIEPFVARLAVEALHDRELRRLGRRVRRGGVRGPVDARARRRREDRRIPPPCATMRGTNACRQCSKPSTLVSTAVRHTSRFGSRSRSALGAPALKNATSTRPKRVERDVGEMRHVARRSRCRWARRRPSRHPRSARRPRVWSRSARRDASTSCIPRSANAVAVARPMPVEPPVITATLPSSPMISRWAGRP